MKIKMMIAALSLLSVGGGAYAGIQLCDNVNLDNDSVHGWGCWTALDPTAAGPTGGDQMDAPTGDAYRTLPTFNQTPAADGKFVCPSGAVCGVTVYWNFNDAKGKDKGPYPAYFIAYPKAGKQTEEGGRLKVSYTLVQINPKDPAPRFDNSGKLTGYYYDGYGEADRKTENKYAWIEGSLDESGQLVTGELKIFKYVDGEESQRGVRGYYVAGIQTPATDMANLAAGVKTAIYTGYELNSENAVRIKVDFGQGTWDGKWEHEGTKGWKATGTLSGSNIQSTAISGHFDQGQVQGSFYGANAGALAGVADVYRVKNNGHIDRHVDVFATTTTGFNSGRGAE